jgi:hypothetical protein
MGGHLRLHGPWRTADGELPGNGTTGRRLLPAAGGAATLVWLRRTSDALVVPALLAEIVVLGALEQYPLFNLRTSHFLLTAFAVSAAIGVTVCGP